jgi:hypothetical protein
MKTKNITTAVLLGGAIGGVIAALTFLPSKPSTAPEYKAQLDIEFNAPEGLHLQRVDSPLNFAPLSTGGTATFSINNVPVQGTINNLQKLIETVSPGNMMQTIRIGGDFANGTFAFAVRDNKVSGFVLFPEQHVAYTCEDVVMGTGVTWTRKDIGDIACRELPVQAEGAAAIATPQTVTTQDAVPVLNSRPGGKIVLFLDFVGGPINDPVWNGGKPFVAAPANYTLDQIRTAFDVCAERYSAFNVNVTTDPKVYAATAVGSRMRIVLTTTNFVSGYGGYAYLGSLRGAGSFFSATVPCFAFVSNVGNAKNAGEVCAHEAGHTFGLSHDGTTTSAYYAGQGSWAPIMGVAYSKPIAQWSKGEYNGANNKQDDIATIASIAGYLTASNASAPLPLTLGSGTRDVISNWSNPRYFVLNSTQTGTLQVRATVPLYSGLNCTVEIRDAYGLAVLAKANALGDLNATVTAPVKPGKYTVKVYGDGEGDVKTTGFTSYGSIGDFVLTGTILTTPVSTGTLKTGTVSTGTISTGTISTGTLTTGTLK